MPSTSGVKILGFLKNQRTMMSDSATVPHWPAVIPSKVDDCRSCWIFARSVGTSLTRTPTCPSIAADASATSLSATNTPTEMFQGTSKPLE